MSPRQRIDDVGDVGDQEFGVLVPVGVEHVDDEHAGGIEGRGEGGGAHLADRSALRHAASRALVERPTEVLVIDMTRVSFFDSSVAHWLLEAHWQATAAGTRVVALVADRDARELLSMLGVAGVISVVDG